MTGVCIKRRKIETHTEGRRPREGRGGNWSDVAISPGTLGIARTTGSWERQGRVLPRVSGSAALPTPSFQTAGLQNWERILFCHFTPPNLWSLVT